MKQHIFLFSILLFALAGCDSIPNGVTAVDNFEKSKYLGTWYEIARMDFKFEKNMINTTANYSLNDDGTIKVLNKGYDTLSGEWGEAEGKAKFAGSDSVAMLKVSFFGPFYAGYNVIQLDGNYQYALVSGDSKDYLWILSRKPVIPDNIKVAYLSYADSLGYDISKLVWVEQRKLLTKKGEAQ